MHTCERHSRDHKCGVALDKCEVVPPVYRRDFHGPVELYGEALKEVDRYKYLGLPLGAKGLDAGRMCGVSIAKAVRQVAYSTRLMRRRRVLDSIMRESANVDRPTEHGIWYALVNLSKGQQVAVNKA